LLDPRLVDPGSTLTHTGAKYGRMSVTVRSQQIGVFIKKASAFV